MVNKKELHKVETVPYREDIREQQKLTFATELFLLFENPTHTISIRGSSFCAFTNQNVNPTERRFANLKRFMSGPVK
jgi:hypothetical protein